MLHFAALTVCQAHSLEAWLSLYGDDTHHVMVRLTLRFRSLSSARSWALASLMQDGALVVTDHFTEQYRH